MDDNDFGDAVLFYLDDWLSDSLPAFDQSGLPARLDCSLLILAIVWPLRGTPDSRDYTRG
jgi:hypothetical protein